MEGNLKGLIELHPAPFNVVLEDDTYKGQMTIGLKIIPNVSSSYCVSSICRIMYKDGFKGALEFLKFSTIQ